MLSSLLGFDKHRYRVLFLVRGVGADQAAGLVLRYGTADTGPAVGRGRA